MRELPLDPEYIGRLRGYFEFLTQEAARQPQETKSGYWKFHSDLARIEFGKSSVRLAGASGFYIPPDLSNRKFRLAAHVWRAYKKTVLALDRKLHLSAPHSPATYLLPESAYDLIFNGGRAFEAGCYRDNPYHFDLSRIRPRFRTADQLRREWFLRSRFLASGDIVHTAFYHALIEHFLDGQQSPLYLEIGAGNGNVASFFHHYDSARVTIVDLPETILYSASYLKSIFPGASILLPNEISGPITADLLRKHDFVFVFPAQISALDSNLFDVIVNLFSMQEMTREQISTYFALIARVGRHGALWCNVNRVEKFCSDSDRPTRAYEFPYDPNSRVLVHQIDEYLELVQPEPHVVRVERLP